MGISRVVVAGLAAGGLLLGGCADSTDADNSTGATTLGVRSTQITVTAAGATPGPGTDGQTLANGDTITTDGTGFGLINYPDSSVTRIDKNAIFTLDDVGTSATQPQVKATLKQGQAWNRVQKITDTNTGQYEITTPYGTVAVRGTTFNIDCTQPPNGCTITVIEGTVEYTPTSGSPVTLTAPTQVAVTANGAGTPGPIPGSFTASQWATTNTGLDAELAASDGAPAPTASDSVQASGEPVTLTGTWRGKEFGSNACPVLVANDGAIYFLDLGRNPNDTWSDPSGGTTSYPGGRVYLSLDPKLDAVDPEEEFEGSAEERQWYEDGWTPKSKYLAPGDTFTVTGDKVEPYPGLVDGSCGQISAVIKSIETIEKG
jgi:uncharacterized cupin superfamily protein